MRKIGKFLLPVAKNILRKSAPVLKRAAKHTLTQSARHVGSVIMNPEKKLKSEISQIAKATGKQIFF